MIYPIVPIRLRGSGCGASTPKHEDAVTDDSPEKTESGPDTATEKKYAAPVAAEKSSVAETSSSPEKSKRKDRKQKSSKSLAIDAIVDDPNSPWKKMADLGPKPPPPLALELNGCVSFKGKGPELDGTGAKLIEKRDRSGHIEWIAQHEDKEAHPAPIGVTEDDVKVLPPLPTLGVSAECLRHFRATNQELFDADATTTDVCMKVVVPVYTAKSRSSVAKCLERLGQEEPKSLASTWVSTANVFVSHAWRYKIKDVFGAMLAYSDREEEAGNPPVYFWFDLFTNDQHDATALPQIWWREAFLQGVKRIGHTLLVLSPWKDPIPLTRAWCLWEILSTMRVGSRLTVEMCPAEIDDFAQSLESEFETVESAVSHVDGRRAEGWKQKDVEMIKKAVVSELPDGFTELNKMISERLREWLYEQGKAAFDELEPNERVNSALSHNLTLLLHRQNKLDEAEALGRECLEMRQRQYKRMSMSDQPLVSKQGEEATHVNVFLTQNQLGRVLADKGEFAEAESYFKLAIDGLTKAQGEYHSNCLVTKNNLADLYIQQGRQDEAEPLLQSVITHAHDAAGKGGALSLSAVLSVMNNLATIYVQKGEHTKSEPLLRRVYDDRVERLGERHADTLTAINNLGSALRAQGKLAETEPLYRQALAARRETLGDTHASTLSSCNNLAVLLSEMKNYPEALPLLLEAYAGYKSQLGLCHPSTVQLVRNLSQVLFVCQTDGQTVDESKQRGVGLTREVLEAVTKASTDEYAPAEARAKHTKDSKLLAMHLLKLLRNVGDQEAIASHCEQFGLEKPA